MVRIYSISVSNAVDGVSSECRACALSTQPSSSTCVPCPPGHYIDARTSQCTECPRNTYLVSRTTPGPDACKPCGPASKSDKVCWRWESDQAILLIRLCENDLYDTLLYIYVFVFFFFNRTTVYVTVTVTSPTQRAMWLWPLTSASLGLWDHWWTVQVLLPKEQSTSTISISACVEDGWELTHAHTRNTALLKVCVHECNSLAICSLSFI